jgi:fucose 4-O-acetylase-like acetyltransferase
MDNNMSHRIGYIDAMRGLTMILVVYSHIQFYAYGMILSHSFNSFFILFRMPLFFFISGWVLYKKTRIWDKKTMLSFLSNKFKVQIVSTLIFFSLYVKFVNSYL